ncbi:MAG: GatB/YqeY domain-containing protein [Cyclobacteriaceae bacterium]|nr:GatB/YqeY domain-containing protein [Cyclobacteriaceae bacterium]MCH8515850.1 GatB/YqeY domain-containing protein [Cyclobacteriaceae bacterium]
MSLKKQVEEGMKDAMRNKDKVRLEALRALKSMILLAATEKGGSEELSEDQEMKLLMKAAKQRKESMDMYEKNGREDLAATERNQLEVINEFLPKPLSEDEIREALKKIIAETGASSPKDMGKVMGAANQQLAGKADGKTISTLVKEMLA